MRNEGSSSGTTKGLRLVFGNAAEDYERGRPGWPEAVVEVGALPPSAQVLDLGAGTGKLTRLLKRRFEHVVAVEPSAEMRVILSRLSNGYEVREGSAETIPLADDASDGIFCAEAFHWFDWPRALEELARVLRPQALLAPASTPGSG